MDFKVSTKDPKVLFKNEKNHQMLKKSWYMLYLWNKDDEAKLKQSKIKVDPTRIQESPYVCPVWSQEFKTAYKSFF